MHICESNKSPLVFCYLPVLISWKVHWNKRFVLMLHMFKPTQLSRLFIGQPRNFTTFRGIIRNKSVSNPHSVSYPMDPGITLSEGKPAVMVRMYNNECTITHIGFVTWYLINHKHNFVKFKVPTTMLLRISKSFETSVMPHPLIEPHIP
jgi:hypothetical protein